MLVSMYSVYIRLSIALLMLQALNSLAAGNDAEAPVNKAMFSEGTPIAESSLSKAEKFSISTHQPNYILPISYNHWPNKEHLPYSISGMDNVEVEFQFSLKLLLANQLFDYADLYVAYTNLSFWQAYNSELSSPFRDTNHEPEIFLRMPLSFDVGSWQGRHIELGFVHQSNGRSQPLSRSWNRLYLNLISHYKNFSFAFKPWYRLPEDDKTEPLSPEGDDNPDITDYLGHYEFIAAYQYRSQRLAMTFRQGMGFDNKGSTELSYSAPLSDGLDIYVKYYYGYGRSLLDYDHKSNAIGIGFAISDW